MSMSSLSRRRFLVLSAGTGAALAVSPFGTPAAHALPVRPLGAGAWTFGLQSDTQWRENLDGENPGTMAYGIQQILNKEFIAKKVDFVVQVGDNVDVEHDTKNGNPEQRNLWVKARSVQPLYDAGIGFFSLRGNHEGSRTAAVEFPQVFPQTTGQGPNVGDATNFSYPSALLKGLSYSFDVKNVRLVMLDQFTRPDGSGSTSTNIIDQLDWLEDRVLNRPQGMHALVFAHKQLIGANHVDVLFGSNPESNPQARDRFISILDRGNVPYLFSGHDHTHQRSILTTPDGRYSARQLIAGSDSHKFYVPRRPANADVYAAGPRETVLAQELWTLTHYIITVDGPRLSIDFYSMSTGQDYDNSSLSATPPETGWFWREQWGYSLNGAEFVVAPGESYTVVQDSFDGTRAAIIAGTNTSTKVDYAGRPMSKEITTGWESAGAGDNSARLYLWGIATNLQLNDPALEGLWPNRNETDESDLFVLQLSGSPRGFRANGSYGIATQDANGRWVNAVDENYGGIKKFVRGAYKAGYPLGTYGVDPKTKNAWAVVNHGGIFVARDGI